MQVRPDGFKRSGGLCLVCKKTLKNTSVERLRSHRKVCRGENDDNSKQIFRLKAEADIEPVSIEEENQDQRTWELHQTTGNENDEETYQIVETTATSDLDESFQQEILESPEIIPIHAVQQVVPSCSSTKNISVSEIVVSDVAERISKAKIKKLTHRTKEHNNSTSYTIVESQSTPNKEDIDTALSIFLIGSNLTFDLVDSDHFRKFVKALNPNYKIPTSTQLKSKILNKLSSTTSSTISHNESGGPGKRSLLYEDSDEDPDEHNKRPKT